MTINLLDIPRLEREGEGGEELLGILGEDWVETKVEVGDACPRRAPPI